MASLEGVEPVKCSRGVVLVPDSSLDSALLNVPYDAIILPGGGPGAKALAESAKVLFTILGTQAWPRGLIVYPHLFLYFDFSYFSLLKVDLNSKPR